MQTKNYAIKMNDDTVSIMRIVCDAKGKPLATVEDEIAKWPDDQKEKVVSFIEVQEEEIPADRTFRNAWKADLSVDMPKAQEIQMDKIRDARAKEFAVMGFANKLDPDVEAAIVPNVTRVKLQALRDIPQTFDLSGAKNPEELKALWPETLNAYKGD